MRRQAIFLFLPIFLVFFVWGLQVGKNLDDKLPFGSIDQSNLNNVIEELPNGQKNILIFIISQMDEQKPEIYGVWLMSYMPNVPYATVLAIYPSPLQIGNKVDNLNGENFKLNWVNGMRQVDSDYLKELNKKNIWFSGYFLIDADGITNMILLTEGDINYSKGLAGESNREQQYKLNNQSISTNINQTLLLQQLCNKLTLLDVLTDLALIRDLFPDHISGNIDPDVMMRDWEQFIKSRNGSFCVFPQIDQITSIND